MNVEGVDGQVPLSSARSSVFSRIEGLGFSLALGGCGHSSCRETLGAPFVTDSPSLTRRALLGENQASRDPGPRPRGEALREGRQGHVAVSVGDGVEAGDAWGRVALCAGHR